jgi:hypothetical protein
LGNGRICVFHLHTLPKVTSRTEFVKQTEFKITVEDRHNSRRRRKL